MKIKRKKKKSIIARVRRLYHRAFFILGVLIGGALGFNLSKIIDVSVEKLTALKK